MAFPSAHNAENGKICILAHVFICSCNSH